MKKMNFSDNDNFYKELKKSLESGEEIVISTNFVKYEDLPNQFKAIFELHKHRSNVWINEVNQTFIPQSSTMTSIDYSALYVVGGTLLGAGIGSFGGLIGAGVGAGIGALVGLTTVAVLNGKHDVKIMIDAQGRLIIHVKPKQ